MSGRILYPSNLNKQLNIEEITELEVTLIEQGKMQDEEIIKLDQFDNWIITPIINNTEHAYITLPETEGESSNTIYGGSKTSQVGQPPRETYKEYRDRDESSSFKSKGKRLPLEQVDKKLLLDEGRILNLTAHDPQKWPTILDMWSQKVCREWESLNMSVQAPQMYSFLEKYLGETVRAMWEEYKKNFPLDFATDLELGANPYNFVNKIQLIILGQQPNVGIGKQQEEAMRKLEQLQIRHWMYIKPFLQDFIYYSSLAGCFYDKLIGEKLFLKLPAPLGNIIHKKFLEHEKTLLPQLNNITTKVKFIVDQLVEECTRIQIGRDLKGEIR